MTNDKKGNFNRICFNSYLDGFNNDANKVITQLESLLNILDDFIDKETEILWYDFILYKKIESILISFDSPTFIRICRKTFNSLKEI